MSPQAESATLDFRLDDAQRSVGFRHLFAMQLDVQLISVGNTPAGRRRIGLVSDGRFEGERLSGKVQGGGADWQVLRADGRLLLDVRLILETADGALLGMTYKGLRHGPAAVIERLERGETVPADSYYFRIAPMFETESAQYGWLNGVVAVGIGHRQPDGPIYNVFEVL